MKEARRNNPHPGKVGGNCKPFFYNNERYLDDIHKKYRRFQEMTQNFIIDDDEEQREKEFAVNATVKQQQRSLSCRQYAPSSRTALSSVYTHSGITTIGEIMEQTTATTPTPQSSNYTSELNDGSSSSASSFSKSSGSSISAAVVNNVNSSNNVHVLTDTTSYTSATVDSGRESIVESPNSNILGGAKQHFNGEKYVNFSQMNIKGTVKNAAPSLAAAKQSLDTRC
jgi:hypothetical protein